MNFGVKKKEKKRRNTHSQPTEKNVDNLEKEELHIPKLQQKNLQKIPTPICKQYRDKVDLEFLHKEGMLSKM